MMETIRVKFLRGTSLGGGRDANPGDVIDLDRRQYAQFAQQGRVVMVDAAPADAAVAEQAGAEDQPKRKGKKNV